VYIILDILLGLVNDCTVSVACFRVIVLENRPVADLSAPSNLFVLAGHESTV